MTTLRRCTLCTTPGPSLCNRCKDTLGPGLVAALADVEASAAPGTYAVVRRALTELIFLRHLAQLGAGAAARSQPAITPPGVRS